MSERETENRGAAPESATNPIQVKLGFNGGAVLIEVKDQAEADKITRRFREMDATKSVMQLGNCMARIIKDGCEIRAEDHAPDPSAAHTSSISKHLAAVGAPLCRAIAAS